MLLSEVEQLSIHEGAGDRRIPVYQQLLKDALSLEGSFLQNLFRRLSSTAPVGSEVISRLATKVNQSHS